VSEFPKPGELFNERYQLEEVIGAGGLGKVFKAFQPESGRLIALKIMHPEFARDAEVRQRFLREAKSLSLLSHPGIVTVYHLGVLPDGLAFIAMELVRGVSLRQSLNSAGRLPVSRALAIVQQICDALSYVHQHGITHRDIKPENIILVDRPEPDTVKLIDFGLARIESEQKITQTGVLLGSTNYMSPEQWKGLTVDGRSDIYSLALCFYEMLSGQRAYRSTAPVDLMYKHLNEPVPAIGRHEVDRFVPAINDIISRAAAKSPSERYQSTEEMKNALAELQLTLESARPSERRSGLRKSAAIAIIAAGCLALCGLLLYYGLHVQPARQVRAPLTPVSGDNRESVRRRQRMEELMLSVRRLEKRYRRAAGPDEKRDAARQLFSSLRLLTHSQIDCGDHKNAENTMMGAMPLCASIDTSSQDTKADVWKELAFCKLSAGDPVSAGQCLKSASACKNLSADMKDAISFTRILVCLQSRNYADADRELKAITGGARAAREMDSESRERSSLDESFYVKDTYQLYGQLCRQKLNGDAEMIAALKFMNDINAFLLAKKSNSVAEPLEYSLSILKRISADAPDYKPVARQAYELRSQFEAEINHNPEGAASYRQKSEMLSK
jgi:hypothetical protein